MWYLATHGYKVLYSDRVVYLCEYLEGGLTKSGRSMRIRNPRGGMWHTWPFMNRDFNIKIRAKNAILFQTYVYFAHLEKKKPIRRGYRLLLMAAKIPGYFLYRFWEKKYGGQSVGQ